MLAQQNRFHGRNSIRRIFARGTTLRGRYMMIRFAPHNPKYPSRVAVVVSKKVFKSAVKRNRIRRRVYNIVRHSISEQILTADVVFTIFSGDVLMLPQEELVAEITGLIERTFRPHAKLPIKT